MYINIEKFSEDKLTHEEWTFVFNDEKVGDTPAGLTFYSYIRKLRETRRHKVWKTNRYWSSSAPGYGKVESEITLPIDILTPLIVKEAIEKLLDILTFNFHKRYNFNPENRNNIYNRTSTDHRSLVIGPLNTLSRAFPADFEEAVVEGVRVFNEELKTVKGLESK